MGKDYTNFLILAIVIIFILLIIVCLDFEYFKTPKGEKKEEIEIEPPKKEETPKSDMRESWMQNENKK
jgi:predicted membrane protein